MTYGTSLCPPNVGVVVMKNTQRYAHLSHEALLDAANAANRAIGGPLVPLSSPIRATIFLGMGA
jgi:hypothetical protein